MTATTPGRSNAISEIPGDSTFFPCILSVSGGGGGGDSALTTVVVVVFARLHMNQENRRESIGGDDIHLQTDGPST